VVCWVRCRLQVQYGANPLGAVAGAAGCHTHYSGPIDCIHQTLAHHSSLRRTGSHATATTATATATATAAATATATATASGRRWEWRHALGVGGLFRGASVTALREVPSNFFYFLTFEAVLRACGHGTSASGKHSEASPALLWLAGGHPTPSPSLYLPLSLFASLRLSAPLHRCTALPCNPLPIDRSKRVCFHSLKRESAAHSTL
jgi:hypothetical protein